METQINLMGGVIYNEDCLYGLKNIGDNTFDVAITSPPYNRIRDDKYSYYTDIKNDYYKMIVDVTNELLRVCKKDVIVNIQATYFNKQDVYKYIGHFSNKLKGIVIWEKTNPQPNSNKIVDDSGNELTSVCNAVEYFFVLNENAEEFRAYNPIKNIVHSTVNEKHFKGHGAIMKYEIADWFVKNFSVEGDTVVDPFLGTGTTAIACQLNTRKYVGYEISKEYCQLAKKRIAIETSTLF